MSLPQQSREPSNVAAASGGWLESMTGHWTEAASRHLATHDCLVRVTVVALRGSAPRDAGASMLVDAEHTIGTIGGGHLEWRAIALARAALADANAPAVHWIDLVLGPDLGQCCGGRVELWLERLTRNDLPWLTDAADRLHAGRAATLVTDMKHGILSHRLLASLPGARLQLARGQDEDLQLFEPLLRVRPTLYIFGAGHVGQALVRLLAELALFDITWIDPRADLLPKDSPVGVRALVSDAPARLARSAPSGTRFVVMTHDHALDFELCRVVLQRDDASWLGLIGSASKSARFRSRLKREGAPPDAVSRLHCPIGVPRISSKLPAALAIAIAAQLLQDEPVSQDRPAETAHDPGPCATAGACESCGEKR
jgi:xanthine dehydrogenase accessory factor